jgi:Ser/Thr protein kinase RdoA (MazF antagonist)
MLSDDHAARLSARYSGPEYADDLAFFNRWRRDAVQAWPVERLTVLPESWLHCDYHGRNVAFQGDTLAGLFDFDFVVRGPRAFDVSRALFVFARERRGSNIMRATFCQAFLDGFWSEQPLTAEELRSLAYMAVLNWVPHTPVDAARHGANDDLTARFRHCIQMMRVTQSEMNRLAPEFGWEPT